MKVAIIGAGPVGLTMAKSMFVYANKAQQETSSNEIKMHAPDFSFINRFMP